MKIEDRELTDTDYLSPVTYVPDHAEGNAGHKDCEQGVLIRWQKDGHSVFVLYCKSRTTQSTKPKDQIENKGCSCFGCGLFPKYELEKGYFCMPWEQK